jgi:hypothetical protein
MIPVLELQKMKPAGRMPLELAAQSCSSCAHHSCNEAQDEETPPQPG